MTMMRASGCDALDSLLKLWQSYCPDKGQWVEFDKHQLSEVNLAFH